MVLPNQCGVFQPPSSDPSDVQSSDLCPKIFVHRSSSTNPRLSMAESPAHRLGIPKELGLSSWVRTKSEMNTKFNYLKRTFKKSQTSHTIQNN